MPGNVASSSVKLARLRQLAVVVAVVSAAMLAFAPSSNSQPYVVVSPAISLSTNVATPGASVGVTLSGYHANASFVCTFASQPTQVGSGTTDASGGASLTITVPSDAALGGHEVTCTDALGASASAPITIEAVAAAGAPGAAPVPGAAAPGAPGLAFTGVPVLTVGSVGIALLIAGALVLHAGRRRKAKA